jgi:hypothetical protein
MNPRKDYGCPLRIYDDPRSADRYTILPPRSRRAMRDWRHATIGGWVWQALAADAQPFHPQGFGLHVSAMAGPHLGQRISWHDLPAEVQRFARLSFLGEYCPKEGA